jgi:hypothetical protein
MTRPKRKAIPLWVKLRVLNRQNGDCAECGEALLGDDTEYDHRPAIILREVNAAGDDYEPPQNDPDHIQALHKSCHLRRTVGRVVGAAKTVTTKGSDAHLAAKFRRLERPQKPKRKWASGRKMQSRPFQKSKRKMRDGY